MKRQRFGRLGVDHIDLLQLHGQDYYTPVEETLSTLDQLTPAYPVWHQHGFPMLNERNAAIRPG